MRPLVNVRLVGSGGFIGSAGRYLLGGWVHKIAPMSTFPLGTLAVNLSGCFLIGLLGGLSETRQMFGPELRTFLFMGTLGGFTTFSSFAHETLALARDAEYLHAVVNVGTQVVGGLTFAWLGYVLVRG